MPSVRVRRSDYSTLRTDDGGRRGSVFGVWPQSSSSPPTDTLAPQPQPPLVAGEETDRVAYNIASHTLPRQRQRSNSRVFDHCMRRSDTGTALTRPRSASTSSSSRPLSRSPGSIREGFITLEGPTADVRISSTGPSLVGSALSLHDSQHDRTIPVDVVGDENHHHDDIVEHLDVIDPEVATVSNLINAANSILIPPLSWYSRKPVVILSSSPQTSKEDAEERGEQHFEDELDRHVDDVLRRRARVKRTLKGVWSFLKTPMGIITGIYGFCVVFWGAAIVIFLAKIINFHNADLQGFWVEVSSQVVNGLFTVTGVGLIPSRVLDTYRIYKIWHYKRRTKKLRKLAGLPQLFDVDDLPDPMYDPNYVHVLTEKEQKDLHRQQVKFQHHQTWYRAHGTETHRAFPINMALVICLLNDGNSVFQVILCATMWGMNRFVRPAWTTGLLIPASFLCGIAAAICIAWGGNKTKRTAEVEERLRAVLAMDSRPHGDENTSDKPTNISSAGGLLEGRRSNVDDEERLSQPEKQSHGDITVDEHMSVPAVDKNDS